MGLLRDVLGNGFEICGLRDLDQSLETCRKATGCIMSSYHARALSLKRLGNSLVTQFYATGKIEALDEAIATDQDAIALMRDKLQGRAEIYHNLGTALFSRFEQLGALEDLDDAFEAIGNARKQPPP